MYRYRNDAPGRVGGNEAHEALPGVPGRRTLVEGIRIDPADMAPPPARAPELVAREATQGTGRALPHLDTIQRAFGRHDLSDVRAYDGAAAAAGSRELGARAFAAGNAVAFDGAPSLHVAAHEAAHIVQQRGGAQGVQGYGRANAADEAHADEVADRVVHGDSVEGLLDAYAADRGARPASTAVHLLRIAPDDQTAEGKTFAGPTTPAEIFRHTHPAGYDTDALSIAELRQLRGILRDGSYRLVDPRRQEQLEAAVDARLAAPPPAPAHGHGPGPAPAPVHGQMPDYPTTATARQDLAGVEAKLDAPASSAARTGGYLGSLALMGVAGWLGGMQWLGLGGLVVEPMVKAAISSLLGTEVRTLEQLTFGVGFASVQTLELGPFTRSGATIGGVTLHDIGIRFDAEALDRAFRARDPRLVGQAMLVVEVGRLSVDELRIERHGAPLEIQLVLRGARILGTHANILGDIARVAMAPIKMPFGGPGIVRQLKALFRDHLQAAFKIDDIDVEVRGDVQRAATGDGDGGGDGGGDGAEAPDLKASPAITRAHIGGLHGAALGAGSREDRAEAQVGFQSAELSAYDVPVRGGGRLGRARGRVEIGPTTVVHSGALRPDPRARGPRPDEESLTDIRVGAIRAHGAIRGASHTDSLRDLQIDPSSAEIAGRSEVYAELGAIRARGLEHRAASLEGDPEGVTTRQAEHARLRALDIEPITVGAERGPRGIEAVFHSGGASLDGLDLGRSHDTFMASEHDEKGRPERLAHAEARAHLDRLRIGELHGMGARSAGGSMTGDLALEGLQVRGAGASIEEDVLGTGSRRELSLRALDLAQTSASHHPLRSRAHLGAIHAEGLELGAMSREAEGDRSTSTRATARLAHLDLAGIHARSDANRRERRSRLAGGALTLRGLEAERHRQRDFEGKYGPRTHDLGSDRLRLGELHTGALQGALDRRVDRRVDRRARDSETLAILGLGGVGVRDLHAEGAGGRPSIDLARLELGAVTGRARTGRDPVVDVGALELERLRARTERLTLGLDRARVAPLHATLGDDQLEVEQQGVHLDRLDARVEDPAVAHERRSTTQLDVGRLRSGGTRFDSRDDGARLRQESVALEAMHLGLRTEQDREAHTVDVRAGDAKLEGAELSSSGDGEHVTGVVPGSIGAHGLAVRSDDEAKATLDVVSLDLRPGGDGRAVVQGTAILPYIGSQVLGLTLPIHGGRIAMGDVSTRNVQTGHRFLVGAVGRMTNIRIREVKHEHGPAPELRVSVGGARKVTATLASLGITPAQQADAPVLLADPSRRDPGRLDLLSLIVHHVQALVDRASAAPAPAGPPTSLAEYKERKLVAKVKALVALLQSRVRVDQHGASIRDLALTDQTASRDAKGDVPAAFADTLHVLAGNLELAPTELLVRLGLDPDAPTAHATMLLVVLDELARTLDVALRGDQP